MYSQPLMESVVRVLSICAFPIMVLVSARADDWPYYQHDAWHTGNSSAIINPQMLSLAWTAPPSPSGYSAPVIVGNSIYAMQNQGGFGELHTTVSSFDLSTGAINWSYTGNFIFPSQPGVAEGLLRSSVPLIPVPGSTCWIQRQADFAIGFRFQKGRLR